MDGKSIYVDHLVPSPKKFFGVIGKKSSIFSKSLAVPAGDHIVQVHLISAEDRFDQTAQEQLKLVRASENTLLINAERGGMSIVNKSFVVPGVENGPSYSAVLRSMLVMVFGSAVSAAIGFVVQEFLRSKKRPDGTMGVSPSTPARFLKAQTVCLVHGFNLWSFGLVQYKYREKNPFVHV